MPVPASLLRRDLRSAYRDRAEVGALHGIFFLTGLGMVVLGPLLPAISLRWHLDDRGGGLLLGAQFLGSFLGAITLGQGLKKELAAGCTAIVFGFTCVAAAANMSVGFVPGVCGFLIAGFGLGRAITSINLIAGARFTRRRASALSLLNLTWVLGALTGPVATERTAERLGVAGMFASLAAVSAIAMAGGLLLLRQTPMRSTTMQTVQLKDQATTGWEAVCFALAFCACGGIEASISGWTSSLTLRSVGGTLHQGANVTTSLWIGMAAGRAIAAVVLLRARERVLLAGGLLLSGMLTAFLLLRGAGGPPLVLIAFALGIALAPGFPALSSLLLARNYGAGTTGRVMAATALGGAIFPWLVGTISEKTGALRHGLWVPVALCVVLAMLVLRLDSRGPAAEERY